MAEVFMIRPHGPNCCIGDGAFRDLVRLKQNKKTFQTLVDINFLNKPKPHLFRIYHAGASRKLQTIRRFERHRVVQKIHTVSKRVAYDKWIKLNSSSKDSRFPNKINDFVVDWKQNCVRVHVNRVNIKNVRDVNWILRKIVLEDVNVWYYWAKRGKPHCYKR